MGGSWAALAQAHWMYSHTQSNALRKGIKTNGATPTHQTQENQTHQKGRKGWDTLWPFHPPPPPTPFQCHTMGGGRDLNSQILSEQQRVWIPHLHVPTPTFKIPTGEMGSHSSEGQWGACLWIHKITANREAIFLKFVLAFFPFLVERERKYGYGNETSISCLLCPPWRGTEPATFQGRVQNSNQLSPTSWGKKQFSRGTQHPSPSPAIPSRLRAQGTGKTIH